MTVLTGADGQLLNGTHAFAKCRDWSITINRDALEDTCLGNMDRTYVEGLRGTTNQEVVVWRVRALWIQGGDVPKAQGPLHFLLLPLSRAALSLSSCNQVRLTETK